VLGLDIGTMWIVKGEIDDVGIDESGVSFESERNVFAAVREILEDPEEVLKENNYAYIKYKDRYYVVGEDVFKVHAIESLFKSSGASSYFSDVRRPMKDGLINTAEDKMAIAIIQAIIKKLVGKPSKPGEILCFCVPGDPITSDANVLFHRMMLTNFVQSLGYTPECINEALALIYSECPTADDPDEPEGVAKFSGIGISMGAGLVNCCLRKDTIIPLLNGKSLSIEELAKQYQNKEFWVYSCDKNGQIVPGKAFAPRLTRKNADLLRVYLDNEEYLDCTPDHKIMMRNGTYKEAKDLKVYDSIMPLYRKTYTHPNSKNSYEKVKNNKTNRWNKTHRLVASYDKKKQIKRNYVVHHKDFNARNNEPSNLEIMGNNEHSRMHGFLGKYSKEKTKGKTLKDIYGTKAEQIRKKRTEGLRKARRDPEKQRNMTKGLRKANKKRRGKKYEEIFGSKADSIKKKMSIAKKGKTLEEIVGDKVKAAEIRKKHSQFMKSQCDRFEMTEEIKEKISNTLKGNIPWNKGLTGDEYKQHYQNGFKNQYNHKVVKIEKIKEKDDVYDITVDKYHNFAVGSGIFVHNCLSWKQLPLLSFAIGHAGDWIDNESSKIAGCDIATITKYKEKHFSFGEESADIKHMALNVYYEAVMKNVIDNFCSRFEKLEEEEKKDIPFEIVIGGGTASVPGFDTKFSSLLKAADLPFKVKEVRMAKNPLYAVCNGCLVKAISVESKAAKKPSKPASEPKREPEKKEKAPQKIKLNKEK